MVHLGMDKQTIDIVCYSSTRRMNLTGTKLSGKKNTLKTLKHYMLHDYNHVTLWKM